MFKLYKIVFFCFFIFFLSSAQDDEPLCTWETVDQDSYFEFVESATKEQDNE